MDYQKPPVVQSVKKSTVKVPQVYLWVWRYSADMSFVDSKKYGVAYLAKTVHINKSSVYERPRLNDLKIPADVKVESVVRVEIEPGYSPPLERVNKVAHVVVSQLPLKKVEAVQIDFDATKSQRAFYKKLIQELSGLLPANKPLKMTALASWSIFDRWNRDLSVSSVTPMFFRMGKDRARALDCLARGLVSGADSIGVATDEIDVFNILRKHKLLSRFKRVYIFSPGGWKSSKARSFARQVVNEFNSGS